MKTTSQLEQEQEKDKRIGLIISIVIHIVLLLLCFFPYSIEKTEQPLSGIVVSFGAPDVGNSEAIVSSINDNPEDTNESSESDSSSENQENDTSDDTQNEEATLKRTAPEPVKEKILTEESEIPIVEKTTDEKSKKEDTKKNEADRAKEAQRIAEEKAKAEAQRKAEKAAAKKAKFDNSKKQFGNLFGGGRGKNNAQGNQGEEEGNPNAKNLEGLAKGSGRVGEGLSDRKVLKEPKIRDNSQETGKIVIRVCVDSNGKVTEAKFTQKGSTTTSKQLIDVAKKAAYRYVFSPSEIATQCGFISIDFKLKK